MGNRTSVAGYELGTSGLTGPHINHYTYTYASLRGMKLNSKKCKEMIINFMQYSPFPPVPLTVGGSVIERVVTYKLLGVYISDDLSWNVHIEHIVKKAYKRLYALRALKVIPWFCTAHFLRRITRWPP